MNKEKLVKECLKFEGSFVDYPFGPETPVIKTAKGKMFAFMANADAEKIKKNCKLDAPINDGDLIINVKCSADLIEIFRKQYAAVLPGYYSNKNHWNTVIVGKDVPVEEIQKMIKLSFELVSKSK